MMQWFGAILTGCALALSACEAKPAARAAKPAAAAPVVEQVAKADPPKKASHRYSPFVLKIESSHSAFDTVSFKDVGISAMSDEDKDAIYETIAEALAQELLSDADMSLASQVNYDESILDPSNHLACGSRHLYVDVWQAKSPDRWGYSLWSGCGDEDNFEWREVEFRPSQDAVEDVSYLARSIRASWKEAARKNCYQKAC